jgi:hypothetical protein
MMPEEHKIRLSEPIHIRFPYLFEGRIGGERKDRMRPVSGVAPFRIAIHEPDEAPLVGGIEDGGVAHEYRMIGGVLHRSLRSPYTCDPLTLHDLAKQTNEDNMRSGSDHPITSRNVSFAKNVANEESLCIQPGYDFQPEISDRNIKNVVYDGRNEGILNAHRLIQEIVSVNDVLYRPSMPPALAVMPAMDTAIVIPCIPEIYMPFLCKKEYGLRDDNFLTYSGIAFLVDPRIGIYQISELAQRMGLRPGIGEKVENTFLDATVDDGRLDMANADIFDRRIESFVKETDWHKTDPKFMEKFAKAFGTKRQNNEDGESHLKHVADLMADAKNACAGEISENVSDRESFEHLCRDMTACLEATEAVKASLQFSGFTP